MVVSLPPMIFGSTEAVFVLALKEDFWVVCPAVSSPARAPATRFSSSVSDGELVAGLTVGVGGAVAAPADEVISAGATAAATPAAATGRAKRMRRLCRPLPGRGVGMDVPPGRDESEGVRDAAPYLSAPKGRPPSLMTGGGLQRPSGAR